MPSDTVVKKNITDQVPGTGLEVGLMYKLHISAHNPGLFTCLYECNSLPISRYSLLCVILPFTTCITSDMKRFQIL